MMRKASRGFTLIEMLVVLTVMSVLAWAALPMAEMAHKRAKERELRSALATIRGALDDFKRAYDEGRITLKSGASGFPSSLQALVEGVEDAKSPRRAKLYFLRSVPRDPFSDGTVPAEQTWALRSYASPPDTPRPGDDVYDVHSTSADIGLNGVAYRQW